MSTKRYGWIPLFYSGFKGAQVKASTWVLGESAELVRKMAWEDFEYKLRIQGGRGNHLPQYPASGHTIPGFKAWVQRRYPKIERADWVIAMTTKGDLDFKMGHEVRLSRGIEIGLRSHKGGDIFLSKEDKRLVCDKVIGKLRNAVPELVWLETPAKFWPVSAFIPTNQFGRVLSADEYAHRIVRCYLAGYEAIKDVDWSEPNQEARGTQPPAGPRSFNFQRR